MSTPVWQIAAGTSDRSYYDKFLDYGIALLGPGDIGKWEEAKRKKFDRFINSFVCRAEEGHSIVLRLGRNRIIAAGIIAGSYEYYDQFDDVYGWDLQHGQRVRWKKLEKEHLFPTNVFGANPPRFSRTWNEDVIDIAMKVLNSEPSQWKSEPLPPLPSPEPELQLVPPKLKPFLAEIGDVYPQFWDESRFNSIPSEDEMVTHFVVPFLKLLGWKTENIGVKWQFADIVLFRTLPRIPENVALVIEAKRMDTAAESAFNQAKYYADKFKVRCELLVTDGVRYRLFNYDGHRIAYANLSRLKESSMKLFEKLSYNNAD